MATHVHLAELGSELVVNQLPTWSIKLQAVAARLEREKAVS